MEEASSGVGGRWGPRLPLLLLFVIFFVLEHAVFLLEPLRPDFLLCPAPADMPFDRDIMGFSNISMSVNVYIYEVDFTDVIIPIFSITDYIPSRRILLTHPSLTPFQPETQADLAQALISIN